MKKTEIQTRLNNEVNNVSNVAKNWGGIEYKKPASFNFKIEMDGLYFE